MRFPTVDGLSTLCCQLPTCLLNFNLCTCIFELLLEAFGVSLGHAFLDALGSAVHQILGFLETELGELAHHLDDLDLLGTRLLENDRELGLFDRGGGSGWRSAGSGGNGQ